MRRADSCRCRRCTLYFGVAELIATVLDSTAARLLTLRPFMMLPTLLARNAAGGVTKLVLPRPAASAKEIPAGAELRSGGSPR